jgi:hypothetical protein
MRVTLVNNENNLSIPLQLDILPHKDDSIELDGQWFTVVRVLHRVTPRQMYVEGVPVCTTTDQNIVLMVVPQTH